MSDEAFHLYLRGIHRKFGYFANWLPTDIVALGDVGVMVGPVFHRQTSLRALGHKFAASAEGPPSDLEEKVGSSIGVSAASSDAHSDAPRISVDFAQAGGFVFQARGARITSIANKARLGESVLEAFHARKWDPAWVVIDTVVRADQTTILVATTAGSRMELATTPSTALGSWLALAAVNAQLSVASSTGDIVRVVAVEGAIPLFRLSRLARPWLVGPIGFHPKRGGTETRVLGRQAAPAGGRNRGDALAVLEDVSFPE
jgi:hypothetical protein